MFYSKKGVSLITVLLFMLVATIAGTATFKWLTSENRSSASRMLRQDANQSSLAGINNARAWMSNHANEMGAIIKQYFDKEQYPFRCDFYIKSEDLFIEVHGNWTHGGRPFDPQDIECQKQLAEWEEKAKTSNYYKNAIYTWTDLDVRKVETAKQNNLNFEVIYYKY